MNSTAKKKSRISLDVDKDLHKKIKLAAIKEGKTIRIFLNEIIKAHMTKDKK